MRIEELDAAIKAVCPIDGIDSGGGIAFKEEATAEQRQAAQTLMDANLHTLDLSLIDPSAALVNQVISNAVELAKLKQALGLL